MKRSGKGYTAIIANARTETVRPILQEKVEPDSIVDAEALGAFNALDASDFHHRRTNHPKRFTMRQNPQQRHREFANQDKRPMRKYSGIKPENFYGVLKECEWHFNGGNHSQP